MFGGINMIECDIFILRSIVDEYDVYYIYVLELLVVEVDANQSS